MEIENIIKNFVNKDCPCGKIHEMVFPKIVVGKGVINELPKLIAEYKSKKVFILADVNTFEVCAKQLCNLLDSKKIAYSSYIFNDKALEPDEKAVGSAVMHYDHSCDLVVAVGSGVINDIGKILSAIANKPYFIVGTAPSMDGYASATSSMSMDGLKISLPSKCADVIIGDLSILKDAPMRMLKAGIGDMLAKYISIAEWRIAHEIVGEYYCEAIASLIRNAVARCVDNANGLLARNEEAVKAVFEGLIIGGIAMALAGCSRPASGMEHYFSHVWDMRGLEFGKNVDLHGLQCAVGTYVSVQLYSETLKITPNKEKAERYAKEFSYKNWSDKLRSFLGKGAEKMIEIERKEGKYQVNKHTKRLKIILDKWNIICDIVREEIPSLVDVSKLFEKLDLPKRAKDIGNDTDLFTTFCATKDIRDKYILSRLLWDIGEIEEFKNFFNK